MEVKFKGKEVSEQDYDDIIEENELITVDFYTIEYVDGVNIMQYEAMLPDEYDDWDYEQMNEYILGTLKAMEDMTV